MDKLTPEMLTELCEKHGVPLERATEVGLVLLAVQLTGLDPTPMTANVMKVVADFIELGYMTYFPKDPIN